MLVADSTGKGMALYPIARDDVSPRLATPVLLLKDDPRGGISDIALIDGDGDAIPEFLVSFFGAPPAYGEISDIPAGGAWVELPREFPKSVSNASGLRVLDQELDGDLDFMMLPGVSGGPQVWQNSGVGTFGRLNGLGIESLAGETHGALVTSLNANGAPDVFLGRPDGSAFLAVSAGAVADSSPWVGVRLLESPTTPVAVRHAWIEFSNGVRMDVGGDGQSDDVAYIGTAGGELSCDIHWPSGFTTNNVALTSNKVTTINHSGGFDAILGIVDVPTVTLTVLPDCRINYCFRWLTNYQTFVDEDYVTLDGASEARARMSDVQVKQWLTTIAGFPIAVHELRWLDQPCVPGPHTFRVHSSRGGETKSGDLLTFNVKVCTSYDPNNPPPGGGQ